MFLINSCLDLFTAAHSRDCLLYTSGGIDESPSASRIVSIDATGEVSTALYYYDDRRFTQPDAQNMTALAKLPATVLFGEPIYDNGRLYVATVDAVSYTHLYMTPLKTRT